MSREKISSERGSAEEQAADTPICRTWLTSHNLGLFLIFLGLFNPLLWVSIASGADRGSIFLNGTYTVLLVAFGVIVLLIGNRRLARLQNAERLQ